MSLVKYEKRDGVGLVLVDNPPVNAFSVGVPRGIMESLAAAAADPDVSALVLAGSGRTFIAGADIKRLGAWPEGEPNLRDAIDECEASRSRWSRPSTATPSAAGSSSRWPATTA